MQIMIIEDDDHKYAEIMGSLSSSLDRPQIIRGKSRNGALNTIIQHYQSGSHFDLIVCDNYMPTLDDSYELKPCAKYIINYVRRKISDGVPICVCSHDELEDCGYDYFVPYDPELSFEEFDDAFKNVLRQLGGTAK